jgi:hypothetical protein
MGKVNVIIVDATGNKEQKVGLPDDIKCGIIMVKLVEKIKLPSVGPDGNPISYKFIHKVTGRQLLEAQTLGEAGIKDGDVLRLQPEITAGAVCGNCGNVENDGEAFCSKCGTALANAQANTSANNAAPNPTYNAYNPNAYVAPNFNAAQVAAVVKQKVKGKVSCVFGMISGILSVLFGLITLSQDTGSWESSSSYGGDAYTGIQNAAAQTANNVQDLAEIVAMGFGFLLIALGLFGIFYFITKMKNLSNLK